MKIFERYLLEQLIRNTLIVIFVLIAVFSIFNLLKEFNEIGVRNYTFASAITFIIFKIPLVISEVFNLGILIGAMATIGILLDKRELIFIQNGMVSFRNIAVTTIKYGFFISVIFLIVFETISPIFTDFGDNYKALKTERVIEKHRLGNIWLKANSVFFYIDKNTNQEDYENIFLIDLTNNEQLILAKSDVGKIINSSLIQKNAEVYKFRKDKNLYKVEKKVSQDLSTPLMLNYDFLMIDEKKMNLISLFNKIYTSFQLGLNSNKYQIEILSRLLKPIYAIILLMIALPIVFNFSRNQNITKNVFVGILIGLIFNLIMKFSNIISLQNSMEIALFPFISLSLLIILARIWFNKKFIKI